MVIPYLQRRFGADSVIHYECRNCGTTLNGDIVGCSACESRNIVKYEWSDEPRYLNQEMALPIHSELVSLQKVCRRAFRRN